MDRAGAGSPEHMVVEMAGLQVRTSCFVTYLSLLCYYLLHREQLSADMDMAGAGGMVVVMAGLQVRCNWYV